MRTHVVPTWRIVVPVKSHEISKTRLAHPSRTELALAFAADTLSAISACTSVASCAIVTDGAAYSPIADTLGIAVVRERDSGGLRGFAKLNAAIRQCIADRDWANEPVAVLTADLPALKPRELALALAAAASFARSFIPDHAGVGTAMLAAQRGCDLGPAFGINSASAHEDSGATRLDLGLPGLRQDVDVPHDLTRASVLGCGPHTRRVIEHYEYGAQTAGK